jgi:hypothetical protein
MEYIIMERQDITIWDSHPLRIGATSVQVFIDGIPQLDHPHVVRKPDQLQRTPASPDWDCEAKEAIKWEGLPPLQGRKRVLRRGQAIRFERVSSAWIKDEDGEIKNAFDEDNEDNVEPYADGVVVIRDEKVDCIGRERDSCKNANTATMSEDLVVDLKGGSLTLGLTTFGSPLGLVEILFEASTNDGNVLDPLTDGNVPDIIGNKTVARAIDGLQFAGRDAL